MENNIQSSLLNYKKHFINWRSDLEIPSRVERLELLAGALPGGRLLVDGSYNGGRF